MNSMQANPKRGRSSPASFAGVVCLVLVVALSLTGGVFQAAALAAPDLGTAESFAVLAGSTVTNTGPSIVEGDLGVSPGTAVTGFPPGIVLGTIHAADAVAAQAQIDVTTAYNDLAGQACNFDLTGQDLGGLTLVEGVYCFSSSAQLTGALVLDAQGNADAVWIFQIGSTLTTASTSSVSVINGGAVCNVYWQIGSSATLGTDTDFLGNILALTSITLVTGTDISGRALARNGAVTMDTNNVSIEACTVKIIGHKFYDTNANGVWDLDEPPIAGWRIEKMPPDPADVTYTSETGEYTFLVPANSGSYTISEVFPNMFWINTTPTSGEVTVAGTDVAGPDFGNVCLCNGGSKLLRFWAGPQGAGLIGADDLALLAGLNLKNQDGTDFDPTSYSQFKAWLQGSNTTNMAYPLSVYLAGLELNEFNGLISHEPDMDHSLIYALGLTSANASGFAHFMDAMDEANAELALHPTAYSGDGWRVYQATLARRLHRANGRDAFVSPTISMYDHCQFVTPY